MIVAPRSERDPCRSRILAQAGNVGVITIRDDRVARLHLLDARSEGIDDRVEIGVDVSVIEFDIIDDKCIRFIVLKLRSLIEERGVVLIALDDEVRSVSELEVLIEIERNAADDQL